VSRFEIVSIKQTVSGLWVVTYREKDVQFPQLRFYGPRYKLKDELSVYQRFIEETEYD
jgi:hypothetical protein